jgi:hypothetical protein
VIALGAYPLHHGSRPYPVRILPWNLGHPTPPPQLWVTVRDWAGGELGSVASITLEGRRAHGFNVDLDAWLPIEPGYGAPTPSYAAAGVAGNWNSVNFNLGQTIAIAPGDGIGAPATLTY